MVAQKEQPNEYALALNLIIQSASLLYFLFHY